jgi:cytochrome oxidase Cu insertion factor (SCO1/SenC/PrrC family)
MTMRLHTLATSTAAVLAAIVTSGPVSAQSQPRQKIDVSKLGPQVGEHVPDFSLKDQNGKLWTLKSIMGPKGAMLVFVRSADW